MCWGERVGVKVIHPYAGRGQRPVNRGHEHGRKHEETRKVAFTK